MSLKGLNSIYSSNAPIWRRKWQLTPVSLSGKSPGQTSWWAAVHHSQRVSHDWATNTNTQCSYNFLFTFHTLSILFLPWRICLHSLGNTSLFISGLSVSHYLLGSWVFMSKPSMYMFHLASLYVPFKPANILPYMYGFLCISFSVIHFESNLPISRYSVQFSSVAQSCPTLCSPMGCSMPGLPVHHQLPEFTWLMSIESVMPFNHLILCHPLLLPPSIFPGIRVFSSESVLCIR